MSKFASMADMNAAKDEYARKLVGTLGADGARAEACASARDAVERVITEMAGGRSEGGAA